MIETLFMVASVLASGLCIATTRASDGLRKLPWVLLGFAAMAASVLLMSQALALGVPLAVAYGVWSGAGIVIATATGVVVFGDRLVAAQLVGLVLVIGGVSLVYST
jgi:small multidrug resistance pump